MLIMSHRAYLFSRISFLNITTYFISITVSISLKRCGLLLE